MPHDDVNPHAGRKLGMLTNLATVHAVEEALAEAGIGVQIEHTQYPRQATELARRAKDGSKLVIAAGADGTVAEVGEALVDTDTALGIMPLGSIMNMARALCIPRPEARAGARLLDAPENVDIRRYA